MRHIKVDRYDGLAYQKPTEAKPVGTAFIVLEKITHIFVKSDDFFSVYTGSTEPVTIRGDAEEFVRKYLP